MSREVNGFREDRVDNFLVAILTCPSCGGRVPEDSVWLYREAFYCSEPCVRRWVR